MKSRNGITRPAIWWLVWLPIPLLLLIMVGLRLIHLPFSFESNLLTLVLNFLFTTMASVFIAYLFGRTFLVRSSPGVLLLGCGVLIWGATGVVANAASQGNPNLDVTIHNLGVALSALCHLVGAVWLLRSKAVVRLAGLWLSGAYFSALATVIIFALVASQGFTPTFFVPGAGGTLLRQCILGSAIGMFLLTALLMGIARRQTTTRFSFWYVLALLSIAVGLLAILLQHNIGGLMGWTGRAAMVLSGVYMLLAALACVREAHIWGVPLELALRESEERFRVAQELSPDGFSILRPVRNSHGHIADFTWVYANPAMQRIVGLNQPTLAGRSLLELVPGHLGATIFDAYQQVAETGTTSIRELQYQDHGILARNWFRIVVVAMGGDIAVLAEDITERKRAEEDLIDAMVKAEQAKAVAETACKAKDQFIAILSHELRTPLTPAMAALALLRRDVRLPGDVRDDLEMVYRNLDLEVCLIADLLDVSRVITGKLHLEKRPMDIADAIREAARIVSADLDAKGQTLHVETPAAPYLAFADAARLQQVFWNLLRNSIKFSPHGGVITIRAKVVAVDHCPPAAQTCPVNLGECPLPQASYGNGGGGGANLVVEVIDQGSGIAQDMLPRIFNVFTQEEKARNTGGLGLGLAICKAVVEMHDGTITAQSNGLGSGSTFTIRLPIAQGPVEARGKLQDGAGTREINEAVAPGKRPLRIVLVEDHVDTAKLMRRLLLAEGHDVTHAGSVAEGLAAVGRTNPDVLITDLGLPDGSGLDLMRRLRDQGKNLPAIALSGYGMPSDLAESKAAGFAEHLTKPLSSIEVLAAALTRLGFCRVSQELRLKDSEGD